MNDTYTWLWISWIALFGVIEGAALINKNKGDTLSEHVYRLIVREVENPNKYTVTLENGTKVKLSKESYEALEKGLEE